MVIKFRPSKQILLKSKNMTSAQVQIIQTQIRSEFADLQY